MSFLLLLTIEDYFFIKKGFNMKSIATKVVGIVLTFFIVSNVYTMQNPTSSIEQKWHDGCIAYQQGMITFDELMAALYTSVMNYLFTVEQYSSSEYSLMLFKLRT